MKLAVSSMISKIDKFAAEKLEIPLETLMKKSGEAVADAVRARVDKGSAVILLAGKGNNGGDGYAAAVSLMDEYNVKVYDVFGLGQKNAAGRYFLNLFTERGGVVEKYEPTEAINNEIKNSGCIIDAVFGTGFKGEMPEALIPLAITVREAVEAHKIAVDVPLGINPDNGSVSDLVFSVEATVALSFIKPGIISYPARAYVGEIIYNSLGLPMDEIDRNFSFKYHLLDAELIKHNLPVRENNSHKGSFGKLLIITGSNKFKGAAHLGCEAALRSGVGLVTYLGCKELTDSLSQKYPEIIYKEMPDCDTLNDEQIYEICELSKKHTATLIGSGSDNTSGLLKLTLALLDTEGGTLVLDADSLNALSELEDRGRSAVKNAKRRVVLTPHPLEFARLTEQTVANVQLHRLEEAEKYAKETGAIVVLKGASTIVTDGESVYINTSGSSALAKAGSGDVLAGVLASFAAQGSASEIMCAAIAVYIHAVAGDQLAKKYSSYGVLPSELPSCIASVLAYIENNDVFDS